MAPVVKNLSATAGDVKSCSFDPGVRKIPWRRKCRVRKIPWRRKLPPTPVFLPGESHRQRNLGADHFSSVQFSCSVVSDFLRPHGLQHTRPPCPSPTPGVYSNSCPLSRWCHPTISSSVVPFSSRLQSSPASGSFQMSQFFTSGMGSQRVLTVLSECLSTHKYSKTFFVSNYNKNWEELKHIKGPIMGKGNLTA